MSLLWIKSVVICRFETIGADIGTVLILFVIIDFVRVRRWMLRLDYDLLLFVELNCETALSATVFILEIFCEVLWSQSIELGYVVLAGIKYLKLDLLYSDASIMSCF